MAENLSKKMGKGIFWNFLEKIGTELISIVVSIILARILLPEDYGIVVICSILVAFFSIFFNHGFSQALIKKQNTDDIDYSTVFYTEVVLSVFFYFIVFFLAGTFASFFNTEKQELLTLVIRVLALKIPILALSSVQKSVIAKNLQFKKFFFISLIGTLLSGVVGVFMALKGYGVWALVGQILTNAFIDMVFLFIFSKWLPKLKFSFKRLKELFSISYKFFIVGVIDTAYEKLRELIIGNRYSLAELSYYNQGKKYPKILATNVNSGLAGVLFPTFSMANSKEKIKEQARKVLSLMSFTLFPCVLGFAVIGESFIKLVLTEKWLFSLPYLYIFLSVALFSPIHTITRQVLKVEDGKAFMWVDIIKKCISLTALIISCFFGVIYIALSSLAVSFINLIINLILNKKYIGYKISEQLIDFMPSLLISFIMGGLLVLISFIPIEYYFVMIIQIVVGVILYILLSKLFNKKCVNLLVSGIKSLVKKDV
ncbi:MAG: lipopolysaccharide biosynthesis protein [Clostridia bacterium]|nr:lipopolysaccharide biosynthesis protein [Clostridia bacterium]